jgi:predicted RNA-binding Zn ribbon-like protein
MLAVHSNEVDFEIDSTDTLSQARREVREWIRRGLVVEREGRVFETDALKTALRFIAQLDGRMMTSTASRLAVVQREIDNLAAALKALDGLQHSTLRLLVALRASST